jgi:hypothetical protein
MKGWRLGFLKLAFMVIALSPTIGSMAQNSKTPSAALNPEPSIIEAGPAAPFIEGLPLFFEMNKGQVDPRVKVLSRGRMSTLYLTPSEVVWELNPSGGLPVDQKTVNSAKRGAARLPVARPAILRMKFKGGKTAPEIIGEDRLPGKSHYFIGNDPKNWCTNVPQYSRGRYKDVYPGVDVLFYGKQQKLEFDFIIEPGRDPNGIRLAFEGSKKLEIDGQGDLVARLGGAEVRLHKPFIYQGGKSAAAEIKGRFVKLSPDCFGFKVGDYDPTRPLIIDPTLSYSTLIGGSKGIGGQAFAEDDDGNIYFGGNVGESGAFTVDPYQPSYGGGGRTPISAN